LSDSFEEDGSFMKLIH